MPIDVRATQAALDEMLSTLPQATARVSREMGEQVRGAAMHELKDPIGPLAESMLVTGPDLVGSYEYRTRTGPTLVYGRQRELGGPINPVNGSVLTAHYRAPGYWTWEGADVFTDHVFQTGQHYLKRGVEISLPRLRMIAERVWFNWLRQAS